MAKGLSKKNAQKGKDRRKNRGRRGQGPVNDPVANVTKALINQPLDSALAVTGLVGSIVALPACAGVVTCGVPLLGISTSVDALAKITLGQEQSFLEDNLLKFTTNNPQIFDNPERAAKNGMLILSLPSVKSSIDNIGGGW